MEIAEILKLRQNANGLNKLMNMHVITLDKDGGATVEVELTDELLNPLGMAHGGTIFTLCDIGRLGGGLAGHGRGHARQQHQLLPSRPRRSQADRCCV